MAARPGYRAAAGTDFTCANLSPVSFHGPIMHDMGASQRRHHPSHAADHVSTRVRAAGYSPPHPQKSPVIKRNIMTTYLDENISGFIFLLNNWLTIQLPDAIICAILSMSNCICPNGDKER